MDRGCMFRTVLKLAAAAAIVLASPALAQQQQPGSPQPPAAQLAPAVQPPPPSAAVPAVPAATGLAAAPAESASVKAAITVPRELSPWSMFMSADVVVKGVMIGLAFASLITWTIFIAKMIELSVVQQKVRSALKKI